jgi:hypothetical protein
MGITVFTTIGSLFAPLQSLARWWLGTSEAQAQRRGFAQHARAHARATAGGPCRAQPVRMAAAAPARPVRILRVRDSVQGPIGSGRLVISGRLADVCAELDRLAALEAANA